MNQIGAQLLGFQSFVLFYHRPDVPVDAFSGSLQIGQPVLVRAREKPVSVVLARPGVTPDRLLLGGVLDVNTDPEVFPRDVNAWSYFEIVPFAGGDVVKHIALINQCAGCSSAAFFVDFDDAGLRQVANENLHFRQFFADEVSQHVAGKTDGKFMLPGFQQRAGGVAVVVFQGSTIG